MSCPVLLKYKYNGSTVAHSWLLTEQLLEAWQLENVKFSNTVYW